MFSTNGRRRPLRAPYLKDNSRCLTQETKGRCWTDSAVWSCSHSLFKKDARVRRHKISLDAHVFLITVLQRRKVTPEEATKKTKTMFYRSLKESTFQFSFFTSGFWPDDKLSWIDHLSTATVAQDPTVPNDCTRVKRLIWERTLLQSTPTENALQNFHTDDDDFLYQHRL